MLLWLFLLLPQEDMPYIDSDIKVDFVETVMVVNLPLMVQQDGRAVQDLKIEQLNVMENGEAVSLRNLVKVQTPVVTHFLFDVSTSNQKYISLAKKCARDLVAKMRPNDIAKISYFSTGYHSLSGYTRNRTELLDSLVRLQPVGSTALYDGLSSALDELGSMYGSRVLVLFSDGYDLLSRTTETELLNKVRNYGIPVIQVSFSTRKKESPLLAEQTRFMRSLATVSDGATVQGAGSNPKGVIQELKRLRTRYLIRFTPPGPEDLEQWRSLIVKVDDCPDCRLEYRRGYQIKSLR